MVSIWSYLWVQNTGPRVGDGANLSSSGRLLELTVYESDEWTFDRLGEPAFGAGATLSAASVLTRDAA